MVEASIVLGEKGAKAEAPPRRVAYPCAPGSCKWWVLRFSNFHFPVSAFFPISSFASSHSVEHSIGRSCAVLNCATQSLREKIPSVPDRASCLPESSRRALVADAWEIRQHQMHPFLTLGSVTDTESVALPSSCIARQKSSFFGAGSPHV